MADLVERLCNGSHPIEVVVRPQATPLALKECVDRRFVHVKFTGTRGGTELGMSLDMDRSSIDDADFGRGIGVVTLVGRLTLDYVPVLCLARIDLASLKGEGSLEKIESV